MTRNLLGQSAGSALIFALLAGTFAAGDAHALPPGFEDELVAGGLTAPTALAVAPDGRIFITEQPGAVRVVRNGALLTAPFAQFSVDSRGERGLLGLAFDPNFSSNQYVYAYHTVPGASAHNRVSRMKASGDRVEPGSIETILDLDLLSSLTNHNGGALHFGPDGKLYVAVGENAGRSSAQSLANRLGKILRINPDGSIPTDNPTSFAGISGSPAGANRAIWAVGLRNPYTFAFQPHSGTMFINDVGQQTWEEVNRGGRGRNYGWPVSEGPTNIPGQTGPAFAYQHRSGTPIGCAISGGIFYDPLTQNFPEQFIRKYFFADFCGDWLYYLDPAAPGTATLFHSGLSAPVDLAVGAGGALLYVQRGNNQLRRIRYTGESVQSIIASAASLRIAEGSGALVTLRLARQPTVARDVAVSRVLSDPSITASPATVRFTPTSWTDKHVSITAGQDSDRSDDGATLVLGWPGITATRVVITALDNDRPPGAPRAIITVPRNGATVSGRNAEFFGDGVSSVDVVRAEFVIDGTVRYTDVNSEGHYHIGGVHNRWNTTNLANGDHLLTMRVYDTFGRWGSHTIKVEVRN